MKWIKKILKYLFYTILILIVSFLGISLIPIKETIKPIQPRVNTQYWSMEGGYKIAYTHLSSTNTRSPIIFIHGGPGGYIHSSIINTFQQLGDIGHDVYLYDQTGSGLSERRKKTSDYSIYGHVNDLSEIIKKQIKAEKVILVGQSFGAIIATHCATVIPKNIDKLILTCPGDLEPYPTTADGQFINIVDKYPIPDSLNFRDVPDYHQMVDRSVMHPRVIMSTFSAILLDKKYASEREMDALMNNMASKFISSMVCDPSKAFPEEGGGGGYARMSTGYNPIDIPDVRNEMRNSGFPVLVLQGQCDQLPFAFSYEYVDLFPNSEYHFIPDVGHDIWVDDPDIYADEIRSFVLNDSTQYNQEIKIIQL